MKTTDSRIAGFDLLRGLCALAVMAYHVLAWNADVHLHTWGTYGVYIFFVLARWMHFGTPTRLAVTAAITITLALLLERFVERPIQEWAKGKRPGPHHHGTSSAAGI